jgi:16S rRNA G966 N2-methylase RsmD
MKGITKDEFVGAVETGAFKFPLKRIFYSEKQIDVKFEKLKAYRYENRVDNTPYTVKNIDKKIPLKFLDSKIKKMIFMRLLSHETDYEDFNILSDFFQEEHRMKCKVYGAENSPAEAFLKKADIIADSLIKRKLPITPFNVRETIWQVAKECSSFRPNNLMAFIQIFNSKSVLDFSAGWGDRLLGAMAAGVDYYAVDPNTNLQKGYDEMIHRFANGINNYEIVPLPIEIAELPTDRKFDLIFTSPPYFDLETYCTLDDMNCKTQSINKNINEDLWFENFLKVAISKTWAVLEPNGILAININQKNHQETYINKMINLMKTELPNSKYLGVIGYVNERGVNSQPIFVARKIPDRR